MESPRPTLLRLLTLALLTTFLFVAAWVGGLAALLLAVAVTPGGRHASGVPSKPGEFSTLKCFERPAW